MEMMESEKERDDIVPLQRFPQNTGEHAPRAESGRHIPSENVNAETIATGKRLQATLIAENQRKAHREIGKSVASSSKTASPFLPGRDTISSARRGSSSRIMNNVTQGNTLQTKLTHGDGDLFYLGRRQSGPSPQLERRARHATVQSPPAQSQITTSRQPLRRPPGPEQGLPSRTRFGLNGDSRMPGSYPVDDGGSASPPAWMPPYRPSAPAPDRQRRTGRRADNPTSPPIGSSDIPASISPDTQDATSVRSPGKYASRARGTICVVQSDDEPSESYAKLPHDHSRPTNQTPGPSKTQHTPRAEVPSSGSRSNGAFGSHAKRTDRSPVGRHIRTASPVKRRTATKRDFHEQPESIDDPDFWPADGTSLGGAKGKQSAKNQAINGAQHSDNENEIQMVDPPTSRQQSGTSGRSEGDQSSPRPPSQKRSLIGSMRDKNGKVAIGPSRKGAFVRFDVDLSVLRPDRRQSIRADLQHLTPPSDWSCEQLTAFSLAFALADDGPAASMLRTLGEALQDLIGKESITYLDLDDTKESLETWTRIPLDDSRAHAKSDKARDKALRDEIAGAADARARSTRKSRHSDVSSATDAGQSRKPSKTTSTDPTQSKLRFIPQDRITRDNADQQSAPRRSSRVRPGQSYRVDDDSDNEAQQEDEVDRLVPTLSSAEKQELLFPFPLTGRAELHITGGDRFRVKTGDFLNDTLLEFGLRHRIAHLPESMQQKVHLFNSFFYDKLSSRAYDAATQEWPAYNSVRKWTKGKSIFEMDYIVVPINEAYHWYLAVIVNPAGILKERATTPPADPPATRARTSNGKDTASVNAQRNAADTSRSASRPADHEESDSDLNELQMGTDGPDELADTYGEDDQDITRPQTVGARSLQAVDEDGDTSIVTDPLAMGASAPSGDDAAKPPVENGSDDVRVVQHGCEKMSIDEGEATDDEDRGVAISTMTTQSHVASFSHGEIQSSDLPPGDDDEISPAPAPPEPLKPKLQIIDSDTCWIITCDSLGGQHKAVKTVLERWLQFEARDKLQATHRLSDALYTEAKVPQQNNFSDCGLWVIHYVHTLLQHPKEVISFIERPVPYAKEKLARQRYDEDMREVWRFSETQDMRPHWEAIINSLRDTYRQTRSAAVGNTGRAPAEQEEQTQEDVLWLSQTGGGKPDLAADQASHMPNSSDIGRADANEGSCGLKSPRAQTEEEPEEPVETERDAPAMSARMSDKTEEEEFVEDSEVGDEADAQRMDTDSVGDPRVADAASDDMSNIDPELGALEVESDVAAAIIPDSLEDDLHATNARVFTADRDKVDPRRFSESQGGTPGYLDERSAGDDGPTSDPKIPLNGTLSAIRSSMADMSRVVGPSSVARVEDYPCEDDEMEPESPFSSLHARREPPRRGKEGAATTLAAQAATTEDVFRAPTDASRSAPGTMYEDSTSGEGGLNPESDADLRVLSKPHQPLKLGSDPVVAPSGTPRPQASEIHAQGNGSEVRRSVRPVDDQTVSTPQSANNKPTSSASSKLTALSDGDELESVNGDSTIGVKVKETVNVDKRRAAKAELRSPPEARLAGKRSAASSPVPKTASKKQKTGRVDSGRAAHGRSADNAIDISSDDEEAAPAGSKLMRPRPGKGAGKKGK